MTSEGGAERDRERAGDDAPSVAFVTVSYGPDRERCELLCKSLDALAHGAIGHWLLVERADAPLFKDLESPFRRLLVTEDVVPGRFLRLPTRRFGLRTDVFVTPRAKPVRGWLLQQLAKLAISSELPCDVIVHADSDVALVRPFDSSVLVDQAGRVRLYRVPGEIDASLPQQIKWHRMAERLLGLPAAPMPLPQFITHLVTWKRENAIRLLDYLDDRGRPWIRAVANAWDVSEYILYGRFVTDVLHDFGGHFPAESSLCRSYWDREMLSLQQIETLLDTMSADEIGVSLTAKAGIPPALYEAVIESRWAARGG